jgi:hypothetical protein
MPKGDILLSLIKEVVKNEVKEQIKEELKKLLESGQITLPEKQKVTQSSPKTQIGGGAKIVSSTGFGKAKNESEDIPYNAVYEYDTEMYPKVPKVKKEYTKNTAINEILNQTQPFTAAQRASGTNPMVGGGSSVLDSIQRESEEDWGTLTLDTPKMSKQSVSSVEPENVDAVTKALTRDYTELVKRFK